MLLSDNVMRGRPSDFVIADRLKAERLKAGFTQTRLAAALGAPQSFIAKLESGERRLLLSDVIAISNALKFDLATFCNDIADQI